MLGLIVGALAGFGIGTVLVLVINDRSLTGSRDQLLTYIFGLPGLLSIPGAVLGAFSAIARYADDADAPVRVDEHGRTVVDPEMASSTGQPVDPDAGQPAGNVRPRA